MTVLDKMKSLLTFEEAFGLASGEYGGAIEECLSILAEMPLESPCGQDCAAVLDAAAALHRLTLSVENDCIWEVAVRECVILIRG